jgi:hypothetical protein
MTEKATLSTPEMDQLREFHAYAQGKAQEARLAQLMVETYIRLAAAKRGLDPEGRYAVSPRGEILPLPQENAPLAPGEEGKQHEGG